MGKLNSLKRGSSEEAYSHITVSHDGVDIIKTWGYYYGKQDVINSIYNMCENRTSYQHFLGEELTIRILQDNGSVCEFKTKLTPKH